MALRRTEGDYWGGRGKKKKGMVAFVGEAPRKGRGVRLRRRGGMWVEGKKANLGRGGSSKEQGGKTGDQGFPYKLIGSNKKGQKRRRSSRRGPKKGSHKIRRGGVIQ